MRLAPIVSLVCAVQFLGCEAKILFGNGPGSSPIGGVISGGRAAATPPRALDAAVTPLSGLRRLTTYEYDNTLRDLLGETSRPGTQLLPEDTRMPFDNDYTVQATSQPLVEGVQLLAKDAIARLLANVARRDAVVGCQPSGPDDAACFKNFLATFGRRAFRRPLSPSELTRFATLQQLGIDSNDFYVGVETAVRAFLQHPAFLFRVELGSAVGQVPLLYRLDDYELATRLSYLLLSTLPPDWLLDAAAAGELSTADGVKVTVQRLLTDPRARDTVDRFHAMWMGFEGLPHPKTLADAMQLESRTLINRVVFDETRPWQDLFRIQETFVDDTLATHYGLTLPGSATPKWVSYQGTGRKGLLSHGAPLSLGAKFSDTSPTQRGLAIRTRLMCQDVPQPPPDVNPDQAPVATTSPCKEDRYAVHRQGSCATCHALMDPIGFGLENYDQQGRYRTTEAGLPQCAIRGVGELLGVGSFSGPGELGEAMLKSGQLNRCAATQLYRFAIGRTKLDSNDLDFLERVMERLGGAEADFRFDELLVDLAASDAFRHRREAL